MACVASEQSRTRWVFCSTFTLGLTIVFYFAATESTIGYYWSWTTLERRTQMGWDFPIQELTSLQINHVNMINLIVASAISLISWAVGGFYVKQKAQPED